MIRTIHQFAFAPAANTRGRLLPVVLWAATIFILSSIPGDEYPTVDVPLADKWVHFAIYAPLGWLLARAFAGVNAWPALSAFAAGLAYAASDELHQLWIRNRTCSFSDWVVDSLGIAAGVVLWRIIFQRK